MKTVNKQVSTFRADLATLAALQKLAEQAGKSKSETICNLISSAVVASRSSVGMEHSESLSAGMENNREALASLAGEIVRMREENSAVVELLADLIGTIKSSKNQPEKTPTEARTMPAEFEKALQQAVKIDQQKPLETSLTPGEIMSRFVNWATRQPGYSQAANRECFMSSIAEKYETETQTPAPQKYRL